MKKLLTLAFILLQLTGNAKTGDTNLDSAAIVIEKQRNNAVIVGFYNTESYLKKIRIVDESGHVLYSKILRKEGENLIRFHLDNLPAGTYKYEIISKEGESFSKKIVKN